jgi:hypothetical protein
VEAVVEIENFVVPNRSLKPARNASPENAVGWLRAQVSEIGEVEPDWYVAAQLAPDDEVDQRVNW